MAQELVPQPGAFRCTRGMLEFWVDPASPYHKPVFASGKEFVFYCNGAWRSALAADGVAAQAFMTTTLAAAVAAFTWAALEWILRKHASILGLCSGAVAGLLIVIGLPFLRRDRLRAYRWFERGILVQIFVTQVFEFADQELAGVAGLVAGAPDIQRFTAIRSKGIEIG